MNLNLILHELQLNRRGTIITGVIFILLNVMFASITASYIGNGELVDILETMPAGLLEAVGFSNFEMMNSFAGFLGTEPYIFNILLLGSFAAIWACASIAKEKDRQSSEFLFTLPYRRSQIFLSKAAAHFIQLTSIYLLSTVIVIVIGFVTMDTISVRAVFLVMTSLYFICLAFMGIGYSTTSLLSSERAATSIGVGIALLTYVLDVISNLHENLQWMAYVSLISAFDTAKIVLESEFAITGVIITLSIYIVGIIIGNMVLRKQDIQS
ncbi:ABC transporter permease subunit [Longirhabdus pacifica]|uniref:ABC transporter permease subunit n=1 Tax=Longirhabdus pacifica TaxID=2305227 RepID=UPI0010090F0C|nr:ABC transporter permease subunit [Longirhabdus pacifica]